MKTLFLLRHAKSGDAAPETARDFDRRLNAKGRRAAQAIGTYCREQGLAFDAVLASPARRVAETLDEVAVGLGRPLGARWLPALYLAGTDDLMDAVAAAPEGANRLLVAGHNPGLERLVLRLVPADPALDAVAEKYPTASLAEIALPAARWDAMADGTGRLVRFVRPRDLDPALGPDPA